jgi:carbamoyl-phosphate synthase large subunit
MPKRTDIKKILIIGSGPIVIGQACEFDYSGSQACKALKEEGYTVVLVNSNPATIMTDPGMADRTYIEPLTLEVLTKIIDRERPDALLPTLGGQTGLNLAVFLARDGVLDKYGVEVIGADASAIRRAEDRDLFRKAMGEIGIDVPRSNVAYTVEEGLEIASHIGYPLILRPAFTLGGTGGATAYNVEELEEFLARGFEFSPVGQVLVEESVLGWKEIEFELMRDRADNVIMVTSMENVDPMGVHTGDSVVVAPAQTLSSKEYVHLANLSKRVIRKIGVTGGGANIQFAVSPDDGSVVIIEVNPRLSRSSALASKATGFPIARVATKLAVGYTLPEIMNQITGETSSFFEPSVDYCIFKISRFTFEKFPTADPTINTSMKSVGEAMSIGRTFKEALQKGLRSLEISRYGLGADGRDEFEPLQRDLEAIREKLRVPNDKRFFFLRHALLAGMGIDEIYELSKIDRWFLDNIGQIVELENQMSDIGRQMSEEGINLFSDLCPLSSEILLKAKQYGFSDIQLAYLLGLDEGSLRRLRKEMGIEPAFKLVDTCAGEFCSRRPYYYSTYEANDESRISKKPKIMILGGGPNRIGQGIEFDYCCVHAAIALRELGFETIMVNSNPETVSTDYDTSDKLYFEPLTLEDVLNIVDRERPDGAIVQFGGQTPLNLAVPLERAGVKILGTSPDSIDCAEDRGRFETLLKKLNLQMAPSGTATSFDGAKLVARRIGYPVMVRPSYVLGGRAMEIVYDEPSLDGFMRSAVEASHQHPVLIDKFLEDAIEIDVDCVSDGNRVVIGGIMEHIEEAGVHSGDSACAIPPYSLSDDIVQVVKQNTYSLARELRVIGLMNVQYAVRDGTVYVLEVNPRASRTVPFISKATGVPLAKLAAKVMAGKSLQKLGFTRDVEISHIAVKESVFPFVRFIGVDPVLGPEMKSTGEVMGIDTDFGLAFAKSQISAGQALSLEGTVFISVKHKDKRSIVFIAKKLVDLGFKLVATQGTASVLRKNGIPVRPVLKVYEGRPNVVDLIRNNEIDMIINTPTGKRPKTDQLSIRSVAVMHNIPCITTISGAQAAVNGIESMLKGEISVKSLQEYHARK